MAALFAVLHVPNTTFPAAKVTQMFVLGLAFGELARRQGLTAAVACHAGLNVGGVLLAAATA